jgi:glutamyl-tRNA(Gln) amidotransferase subunit D
MGLSLKINISRTRLDYAPVASVGGLGPGSVGQSMQIDYEDTMSKRVAVVTTGGTINSVIAGKAIVADTLRSRLRSEIEHIRSTKNLSVDVYPALEKMSEDMAPTDWLIIIQTIQRLISEGYKSIIVTHGTDTMAYTAAAIALYFNNNNENVKICLTGSFYPLEHPESDARTNLEAALEVVVSEKFNSGVYVAFRLNRAVVCIYHGLEISPISYDSSTFGAMYGKVAAIYSNGRIEDIQPRYVDFAANSDFPSNNRLRVVGQYIYQMLSYPGLNLSIFTTPRTEKRLIIIDAYHSGTASSERFAGTIIDFKNKNPHVQIALSCVPTKYLNLPYQSTFKIMDAGVNVYTDISPLLLYVLAACRFAAGVSFESLLDPVSPWLLNVRLDELNESRKSLIRSASAKN